MSLKAAVVQTVWMLVPRWRVHRSTLYEWANARHAMSAGTFVQALHQLTKKGLVENQCGHYWLAEKSLWTVPSVNVFRRCRYSPARRNMPELKRAVQLTNGNLRRAGLMAGYSYRTMLDHFGAPAHGQCRTRKRSNAELLTAVQRHGSTRAAARALGVGRSTIMRALKGQRQIQLTS